MPASERTCAIRRALARYLRTHPQACDTAAGIARWWLPQDLDVAEFELLPVLQQYVARGLIGKFVTADGRWFYRRRVAHRDVAAPPPSGRKASDLH